MKVWIDRRPRSLEDVSLRPARVLLLAKERIAIVDREMTMRQDTVRESPSWLVVVSNEGIVKSLPVT